MKRSKKDTIRESAKKLMLKKEIKSS